MLVIVAIFLSITGGYFAGVASGAVTAAEFVQGLSTGFVPFTAFVAMVKALIFAFEITTISAYQGFYTKGGALEVGQSSTKAVVVSCIAILVSDYIIAQLLL
jgi:phospholipid/cholesterol/gamma-HCH transport system permease protein